jgi:Domain of unknown function (DUF3883)
MNTNKAREIIKRYKQHFHAIHKEEIYKWRAVKYFQDNWNPEANDFAEMLSRSLHLAKNLLDSGKYFPKRMINKNAVANPEAARALFIALFDENADLIERMEKFQSQCKSLNATNFPGTNSFQDTRATIFYLCLRFPERYFLYKYEMFKGFVGLVDYPFHPKRGDMQNVLEYLTLCNILKEEILRDNELLELHKTRITEQEYFDSSFNILTQDVIYAAVRHIDKFETSGEQPAALARLIKIDRVANAQVEEIVLKGRYTNYVENEKERKRLGDLGELLVLQHEQEKLMASGSMKRPQHKSKSEGDGLGYDILSYDETGDEILIEVKTTAGSFEDPLYITGAELLCSQKVPRKYWLYRVYEYDDINNSAKYSLIKGDLTEFCINPILYKVKLS